MLDLKAMSALYQRARPSNFSELVGQEHVREVLSSAIELGRTSHAYLFSGPRGVGKTTVARLLAMAVNCSAEPAGRPCGECESCLLVRSGSHPDVMELDAASHNSVEDIRELRERTGLASLMGGVRVFILDEAHMLSKAAANALLKTLEEPPPHLLFILATTEPERLPPTILSRCQHFRFRRLTDEQIQGKLERLTSEAGVDAEAAALNLVARSADGGMRDAESLLDRLLVSGEPITLGRTEETLGLPPGEQLAALANALATGDVAALLEEAGQLYRDGFAPRTVASQTARYLRDELHQALAERGTLPLDQESLLLLLHALDDEQERFVRQGDLYALEVALLKALNAATGNVPQPASTATTVDAGLLVAPSTTPPEGRAPAVAKATREPPPQLKVKSPPPKEAPAHGAPQGASTEPEAPAPPPQQHPQVGSAGGERERPKGFSWHAVRSKAGPQLKAFLMPAAAAFDGQTLALTYEDTHEFHYNQLLSRRDELLELLEAEVAAGLRIQVDGPGGRQAFGAPATPGAAIIEADSPSPPAGGGRKKV